MPLRTRLSLLAGSFGTLVLTTVGPGTISGRVELSNGGVKPFPVTKTELVLSGVGLAKASSRLLPLTNGCLVMALPFWSLKLPRLGLVWLIRPPVVICSDQLFSVPAPAAVAT